MLRAYFILRAHDLQTMCVTYVGLIRSNKKYSTEKRPLATGLLFGTIKNGTNYTKKTNHKVITFSSNVHRHNSLRFTSSSNDNKKNIQYNKILIILQSYDKFEPLLIPCSTHISHN